MQLSVAHSGNETAKPVDSLQGLRRQKFLLAQRDQGPDVLNGCRARFLPLWEEPGATTVIRESLSTLPRLPIHFPSNKTQIGLLVRYVLILH